MNFKGRLKTLRNRLALPFLTFFSLKKKEKEKKRSWRKVLAYLEKEGLG